MATKNQAWKYEDGQVCDDDGRCVAKRGNDPRVPPDQRDANMRLCAAAPALLAALRKAKSRLIELYEEAHPNDEPTNDTSRAIDCAIAAISLAGGENH
jgi:hypothetical protein